MLFVSMVCQAPNPGNRRVFARDEFAAVNERSGRNQRIAKLRPSQSLQFDGLIRHSR